MDGLQETRVSIKIMGLVPDLGWITHHFLISPRCLNFFLLWKKKSELYIYMVCCIHNMVSKHAQGLYTKKKVNERKKSRPGISSSLL